MAEAFRCVLLVYRRICVCVVLVWFHPLDMAKLYPCLRSQLPTAGGNCCHWSRLQSRLYTFASPIRAIYNISVYICVLGIASLLYPQWRECYKVISRLILTD
ncbi:hypothetical protein F4774DRAFT_371317 [Daldinia eschscholtzii]|nr:hypothetical protein F4774DRAFT_371317 [Daldinia eschscholtzii]